MSKDLSNSKKHGLFQLLTSNTVFILLAIYLVMLVFLSIRSPYFLSLNNVANIGISISVLGVSAMGVTMVIFSGGLDLSVSASMALCNVIVTTTLDKFSFPWGLAVIIGILASVLVGFLNGLIITQFSIHPTIVTLGMANVVRGLSQIITDGQTILLESSAVKFVGSGKLFNALPVPVIIMVIVIAVMYYVLRNTLFGRAVYSVGGNARAAYLAGISVKKTRLLIFSLTGLFAGISGVILTGLMGAGLANAATGWEMDIITAVLLGGTSLTGGEGSVLGTALGLIFIGTLNNGMTMLNVNANWQTVAKGVILLFAVILDSIRKSKMQSRKR